LLVKQSEFLNSHFFLHPRRLSSANRPQCKNTLCTDCGASSNPLIPSPNRTPKYTHPFPCDSLKTLGHWASPRSTEVLCFTLPYSVLLCDWRKMQKSMRIHPEPKTVICALANQSGGSWYVHKIRPKNLTETFYSSRSFRVTVRF